MNSSGFIVVIVSFIKDIKGDQYHICYSEHRLKGDLMVGLKAFAVDWLEGLWKGTAVECSFVCVIRFKQNARVLLKRHNSVFCRVLLVMVAQLCICVYILSYVISLS